MICSQCGALLVEHRFMDGTARWRCVKCGHIHHSASVENHLACQRPDFVLSDYLNEEAHFGSASFVRPEVSGRSGDSRSLHQPKKAT